MKEEEKYKNMKDLITDVQHPSHEFPKPKAQEPKLKPIKKVAISNADWYALVQKRLQEWEQKKDT